MGGRNDGRRLHGNGELRERSSFIRSRSLRTHPRRAGLAVAMVTGKPSHAPVRPPEGKRGQGAVSGFLWGSLTGERGPGRRVGPQHHREGRPGRPERPSQGAAEGLAAGLPAPGFIVTNCWDGQCPWTGGTHAACSSGNSRCSPRPFLRSRDVHILIPQPVTVSLHMARETMRPYSQDAVLGAGPRMEARAQSSRQEASPSQSPGGRQGTGEPPDGAEACGRGSSKETPVSEGRSARRDRRWPDDSPRQRLLGPGTRREPSPGTRQSAGAGLLVQEPNGPTSSRDPDLVPPQGLQAEEGSCSGEPGAALARGSPLRAPPRRSPRSIPSSGSFLPPPIPGLGPRPGRCHHCFPHRVICAQAATPRGVPLRPSMQSHPRLLAAAQAQLPLGPKPSWGILCAACPPFIHSVFFRPVPRR
ncbi:zinc finger protein 837 isoform X2 [Manis javanica]|uniref:zinc finger protein 837 isoform X2 n=2 Tax=Manis javanica TaxID=9974 RepID=UPI003C6DABD2